jgi:quercetin dioxygenase-like cupin family protein
MNLESIDPDCICDESLPWLPFTPYSDEVKIKYFKLDPVRGEIVSVLKVPPGVQLPKHHHTGSVIVYTVQGRWKYLEHAWTAEPGSVVYETASSDHTPVALDNGTQDVITFNITHGELIFLDENDRPLAVENWKTSMQRYLDYCRQHGLVARDLTSFDP